MQPALESYPRRQVRAAHSRHHLVAEQPANWYDRTVVVGVIALVMLAPMAMGAVHPWAFIAMEVAIFAMVAVWMAKIAFAPPIASQPTFENLGAIVLPLGLFLAFVAIEIVPMPPAMLRAVSPATYSFYAKTLTGWPSAAPFSAIAALPDKATSAHREVVLPTPGEVAKGASVPKREGANDSAAAAAKIPSGPRWLPLSLAPAQTREMLLKLVAYAAFFFFVLLYPFGPSMQGEAEKRFYRAVLIAVITAGLIVACVGILQRVFWNGKILWMFVPYDWGRAIAGKMSRARGPFVNPDHFGAYLNLIIPIAIAGALFPTFVVRRRSSEAFRVFCLTTVIVGSIALLLSMSRAGWIGAVIGAAALIFLCSFIPVAKRPALLQLPWKVTLPIGIAAFAILIVTSSAFVGGEGRHLADQRLQETVKRHASLDFRLGVWRNTIPMLRDFPLFGIGVGAFEDVYPIYATPPANATSVREAHNDYLELFAGAGVIGFALLAWFFVAVGVKLYRGIRALPPDILPVGAALAAAMAVMAFQETFDFNLQIPANALMLTLFLALVFRLVATVRLNQPVETDRTWRTMLAPGCAVAAAAILAIVALRQSKIPYPYNLAHPKTFTDARRQVLANPAAVVPRLWMIDLMKRRMPPAMLSHELATAVWLDPTNSGARDLYAQSLIWNGNRAEAMDQIARSVYSAPWLGSHFYLEQRFIPWLAPDERAAVEKGLREAIANDFMAAVWTLATIYDASHEYADESKLLADAAANDTNGAADRANLLVSAGTAAAWSGDVTRGERYLREAAALDPSSPDPYRYLATVIFGPQKKLADAHAAIEQGIRNGADPFALYLAMADAAQMAGDSGAEEKALNDAVNFRPSDYGAVSRLASLYMGEKQYDQAALLLKRATEIHPDDAQTFYSLGLAEEAGYNFFAANRDFARAMQLAPQNGVIKAHYAEFQKRTATSSLNEAGALEQ